MGYKNICINCRKAFNQGTDFENIKKSNCPECGREMVEVNHIFRPPKKNDIKKWETVKFLIENGFIYHHVYETIKGKNGVTLSNYAKYPENIKDAKEFVIKFKDQALKE